MVHVVYNILHTGTAFVLFGNMLDVPLRPLKTFSVM